MPLHTLHGRSFDRAVPVDRFRPPVGRFSKPSLRDLAREDATLPTYTTGGEVVIANNGDGGRLRDDSEADRLAHREAFFAARRDLIAESAARYAERRSANVARKDR